MKFRRINILIAVILCISIFTLQINADTVNETTLSDNTQAENTSASSTKSEVIYATLNSEGVVNAAYAVNHFETSKVGSITDYGKYTSVLNVSNMEKIELNGEDVTFNAEAGDFYYQGNMESTELPWNFDITYTLDNEKQTSETLAGKSGNLTIQIKSSRNKNTPPVFYEHYMLQISLTMNTQKCSEINSDGAVVAEAGKNKMINYTILPKKDADITISAVVKDFEMSGIDISAMPFSMNFDLPDTGDITNDLTKLSDAISSLNNGVGELADGVSELSDGASGIKTGSAEIKDGLSKLGSNAGQLTDASNQIKNALKTISSSMSGNKTINLDDMKLLPQGLKQLSEGLEQISAGMKTFKNSFVPAYNALDASINQIPDSILTEQQFGALYAGTDQSQYETLNKLKDSYIAAQTVKGTYKQVKAAFSAVETTMDRMSGSIDTIVGNINKMVAELESSMKDMESLNLLPKLINGISELSENYGEFHKGLAEYTNGVKELSSGYNEFDSGLVKFGNGIGELKKGTDELHDGTNKLNDETSKMPQTMQKEIDTMINNFIPSDFEPVSFISDKNKNVGLVQFVLKCEGVEKIEEDKFSAVEVKNDETFLDRFIALFKK